MMAFEGFSSDTRKFFFELSDHNDKGWFEGHNQWYRQVVLSPAEAFITELGQRLQESYPELLYGTARNGTGSLMRIYRDIRFSTDKRPFKTNLGIIFTLRPGKKIQQPCFYFHLDPFSCFFYAGLHQFDKPILERYRLAVDTEQTGKALERILEDLAHQGLDQCEEPGYKRVPQGFDRDHPRAELLKLSGIGVLEEIPDDILCSSSLIDTCLEVSRRAEPLLFWLLANL